MKKRHKKMIEPKLKVSLIRIFDVENKPLKTLVRIEKEFYLNDDQDLPYVNFVEIDSAELKSLINSLITMQEELKIENKEK